MYSKLIFFWFALNSTLNWFVHINTFILTEKDEFLESDLEILRKNVFCSF